MNKLKILDLFAGIGGFSYGLEATGGFSTTAFCEIDPYCQKVLKKHWADVPIHADIKGTDFGQYTGRIDVITGGYPCQPFSNAGKQRGEEDPRHLWPRMREVIEQVRPTWVICENVHGHIKLGLDKVLLDLENLGYTTRTFIVPACGVNAPHRRNRLWIISYSEHNGSSSPTVTRENHENARKGEEGAKQPIEPTGIYSPEPVAHSDSSGWRQGNEKMEGRTPEQLNSGSIQSSPIHANPSSSGLQGCAKKSVSRLPNIQIEFERSGETVRILRDSPEPGVCGTANGFPGRVDRIKALGNSVVPQIVFNIGKAILHVEEKKVPQRETV